LVAMKLRGYASSYPTFLTAKSPVLGINNSKLINVTELFKHHAMMKLGRRARVQYTHSYV